MQKINKIPLPICGVILGLAALGNLIQSYSNTARLFCGIIAATLLVFFNIKKRPLTKLVALYFNSNFNSISH